MKIYEKYPEWAFQTIDGEIMEYNGYVQACINGEYQQKYVFEIITETFDKIPFDGLFCNMGGFQNRDYDFKDYGFVTVIVVDVSLKKCMAKTCLIKWTLIILLIVCILISKRIF